MDFSESMAQRLNGFVERDEWHFRGVLSDSNGDGCFLQELPEDVWEQLSTSLSPRALCNLSLTCRKLHSLCDSDKLWWPQCKLALNNSSVDFLSWRIAVSSFKSICRFILSVRPLLGIWVHQNPELGNLVYVTWGFLSVVGCRIIPQELGPQGLETGLLWAPVFEIVGHSNGSLAFFLHGRESERDCCYPGCFDGARDDCNVLLLEAEPRLRSKSMVSNASSAFAVETDNGEPSSSQDDINKLCRTAAKHNKCKATPDIGPVPFHRLHFADRKKMLDAVARHVRLKIPQNAVEPLFPSARNSIRSEMDSASVKEVLRKEIVLLSERRSLLMGMFKNGDPHGRWPPTVTHYNGINSAYLLDKMCSASKYTSSMLMLKSGNGGPSKGKANGIADTVSSASNSNETLQSYTPRKPYIAKLLADKMKQMIGMGKSDDTAKSSEGDGNTGLKRVLLLQQFVKQGDTVALRLHARCWELKTYRAWPLMPDNRFALYKMFEQKPENGRELVGVWGGTFGWPPGKHTEDKPGKALYLLLLSYEDTVDGRLLIATKILEGTHYVLHPNGSPMFTAYVGEPSSQCFPWHTDKDGGPVEILHAYPGEGIANGYGFRYPSSKPGDLFVERTGLLAFVWRESQNVLTLQRLNLQALLESGERVAALGPIANYAYLIKSLSNVFAGFCGFATRAKTVEVSPV